MTSTSNQRVADGYVAPPLLLAEGRGVGMPGSTTTLASLQRCAENCFPAAVHSIPSRLDNPFATCWTKPGAIPFHFPADQSENGILEQLAASNWRGAIIGPHGSGKSTLLETLKPRLIAVGHKLTMIALRSGQRSLPRDFVKCRQSCRVVRPEALRRAWRRGGALSATPCDGVPFNTAHQLVQPPIVIVDGYEQLTWTERLKLIMRCRRRAIGLLVTSHRRTRLPTLVELHPELILVEQLVAVLCDQVSTRIDPEFIAASHACHGSNVREIFFDLYDRYERIRRRPRTS